MGTITAESARKAWGKALAAARTEAGRSQENVGDATDLDQRTVSRAENGVGSLETFVAIANELGLNLFGTGS